MLVDISRVMLLLLISQSYASGIHLDEEEVAARFVDPMFPIAMQFGTHSGQLLFGS
jgi:hypothetical protein